MPETTTTHDEHGLGSVTAGAGGPAAADADASERGYRGPTIVVEAATAEAAIAEVHERFGPAARIVDASRELRGGVRGFFAKQVVELHVAVPGEGAPADLPPVGQPLDTTPPAGLDDPPGRGPAFAAPRRPAPRPERPLLGRTEPDTDELTDALRAALRDGRAAVADGHGGVRASVDPRLDAASAAVNGTGPAAGTQHPPVAGSPVDRLLGGLAGSQHDGPSSPVHGHDPAAAAAPAPTADPAAAAAPAAATPVGDRAPATPTAAADPAPTATPSTDAHLRSRGTEDRAFAAYLRQQLGSERLPDDLAVADDGSLAAAETDPRPAPKAGRLRPPSPGAGVGDDPRVDAPTGAWALVGAAAASGAAATHHVAEPPPVPAAARTAEPAGLTTLVIPEAGPASAAVAAPAAVPATSVPAPQSHPIAEPAPATDGGPAWSATALIRLGLPAEWVRSLPVAGPADDLAWLAAVTEAVRGVCRPLPGGAAVLVGEHAPAVAEVTGDPVARSRTFQTALQRGRWVHLVAGGTRWRELLGEDPLAVSWTEPTDLPDALRCALELGLVLGHGPLGGTLRRARPVDVALALRALVEE